LRELFRLSDKIAEHAVQVGQNLIVPIADDGDAILSTPGCSTIVRLFAQLRVLAAVDFDCKAQLRAIEVDGIWPNRMLPPETQSIELIATKGMPKTSFRICHVCAEIPSALSHAFCAGKA